MYFRLVKDTQVAAFSVSNTSLTSCIYIIIQRFFYGVIVYNLLPCCYDKEHPRSCKPYAPNTDEPVGGPL